MLERFSSATRRFEGESRLTPLRAARGVQLTADREVSDFGTSWSLRRQSNGCDEVGLEKGVQRLALDAEVDHAIRAVHLLDRRGRDDAASAGEEAGANRERVRDVGRSAVHRPLDATDEAPACISNAVPGG